MSCSRKLALAAAIVLAFSLALAAQAPDYKNLGRAPTSQEIKAWDDAIGVSGRELPPGAGTAKEGGEIFAAKCVACHGNEGQGSALAPRLVGREGNLTTPHPVQTIGSYWPFATTIFDFIQRAMPKGDENTLSADQIYAVTAFLLYKNNIVKETDVVDAKTLPKIVMPNRYGFIPADLKEIHDPKKRGCRLGHCP